MATSVNPPGPPVTDFALDAHSVIVMAHPDDEVLWASSALARCTCTTVIASTSAPLSFASAIAVATISSPMSPSFIGTRIRRNDVPTGSAARGSTPSRNPRRSRQRVPA